MTRELDLREPARARLRLLATLPQVPETLAPAVIATWHGRMVNEHGSARVFDAVADQLAAIGRADEAAQCRTFADEERSHGASCGAVVEWAGGAALATIEVGRPLPVHADTTPRAAVIRNLLSIGCLAETVAVALIGAERLEMPDGPLRELLTSIWSDEIGHARFGWLYVARALSELDAAERDAVVRYLPIALGSLEAHEVSHLPVNAPWPAGAARFGLCDGGDARTLFYETVSDVIVPQLETLGLPAVRAWQGRRI